MKVENSSLNSITPQKAEGPRGVDKTPRPVETTPAVGGKDKAELSEKARLLSKAMSASDTSSTDRQAKVANIKQQVDNGTYSIPLSELANRLHKLFP
jgi:flagellar biosynthesis anti-sigma factor FlgM